VPNGGGVPVGITGDQPTCMRMHWGDVVLDVEITGAGGGYLCRR
jgi:hypothetical protein